MMSSLYLVFLLGIYHGINPAMGWLFATMLGLQRNSLRTVLLSVVILCLGHATAIIVTLGLIYFLKLYIPLKLFTLIIAIILFLWGTYLLFRMYHPTWIGMNIGYISLFMWSFFVATAHGAGLMLSPFVIEHADVIHPMHHHGFMSYHQSSSMKNSLSFFSLIVFVHMIGYLLVTSSLSAFVYLKLGLRLLKKTWFNFDIIWACALLITGAFMLKMIF